VEEVELLGFAQRHDDLGVKDGRRIGWREKRKKEKQIGKLLARKSRMGKRSEP
jgi:hypothetical protein